MADKLTIQDYLDFFGDKSSAADEALESTFGASQRGSSMTPEMMQLIMGAVEPGGGIKALGKAAARGGKNILDILKELVGKGKSEIGDIPFTRGAQREYFPSILEKPLGQQELFPEASIKVNQAVRRALQLPKQELGTNLPALINKPKSTYSNLFNRKPMKQNMLDENIDVVETLKKIRRLQDEVSELSGRVVGGPLFRRIKK